MPEHSSTCKNILNRTNTQRGGGGEPIKKTHHHHDKKKKRKTTGKPKVVHCVAVSPGKQQGREDNTATKRFPNQLTCTQIRTQMIIPGSFSVRQYALTNHKTNRTNQKTDPKQASKQYHIQDVISCNSTTVLCH